MRNLMPFEALSRVIGGNEEPGTSTRKYAYRTICVPVEKSLAAKGMGLRHHTARQRCRSSHHAFCPAYCCCCPFIVMSPAHSWQCKDNNGKNYCSTALKVCGTASSVIRIQPLPSVLTPQEAPVEAPVEEVPVTIALGHIRGL